MAMQCFFACHHVLLFTTQEVRGKWHAGQEKVNTKLLLLLVVVSVHSLLV